MNKYKHAWKRIESLDIWSIPPNTPSSNWGEYIKCGDDIEASYQISEDLELIKELVDKATPMKPRKYTTNGFDEFECDNCGDYIKGSYCSDCGQKIDWSGEE